jgi:hypothetical protein
MLSKASQNRVIRLGQLFGNKYAVDASSIAETVRQSLWTALANASTVHQSGIMPFVKMLKEDDADMNINITRNGDQISVSPPSFSKPDIASKYFYLPQQIVNYLEKYINVFPAQQNGDSVDYKNLTITLTYKS